MESGRSDSSQHQNHEGTPKGKQTDSDISATVGGVHEPLTTIDSLFDLEGFAGPSTAQNPFPTPFLGVSEFAADVPDTTSQNAFARHAATQAAAGLQTHVPCPPTSTLRHTMFPSLLTSSRRTGDVEHQEAIERYLLRNVSPTVDVTQLVRYIKDTWGQELMEQDVIIWYDRACARARHWQQFDTHAMECAKKLVEATQWEMIAAKMRDWGCIKWTPHEVMRQWTLKHRD